MVNSMSRPSLFWLFFEPSRALTEMALSFPFTNILKHKPTGDGHPVMILPGFLSSEKSTKILRKFITNLGYTAYDWGLGRNLGDLDNMGLLIESIDEIHKKTGQQVSLIGWSLGGIFARQIAKEKPECIRQLITLGSPFRGLAEPNNVEWIFRIISKGKRVKDLNKVLLRNLPSPAKVPTTAIYSKEDGIVPWEMCMEKREDKLHQNVQVRGSHIGLAFNPSVLTIIADRLQQTKQNWHYFKPTGLVDNLILPS